MPLGACRERSCFAFSIGCSAARDGLSQSTERKAQDSPRSSFLLHFSRVLAAVVLLTLAIGSGAIAAGEPAAEQEPTRRFPEDPSVPAYDAAEIARLVEEAKAAGAAERGAMLFASPTLACISCHKVGSQGGNVGPELTSIGTCLSPEQIAESLLWPNHRVRLSYVNHALALADGTIVQGYKVRETDREIVLRDPQTSKETTHSKSDVDARRATGSLMPAALVRSLKPRQKRDLVRFLIDLGHRHGLEEIAAHAHAPASFPFVRDPLFPDEWPHWQAPVNRDRVYDFYTKEAAYFANQPHRPMLTPEFPGLDGGTYGHWGNQNEEVWKDDRWNETDLGSLQCGGFRGTGVTVAKGVCVRLGDDGELAACFNPQTLTYDAVWKDGFLSFSEIRHGFMHGMMMEGTALERPAGRPPAQPLEYHGFYRDGKRVVFSYRIGDVEYLDAPWTEDGEFVRTVAPVDEHPLRDVLKGGDSQWPQEIAVQGQLGRSSPYAVDTIPVPFENPWKALMFFGGHDFTDDGTAYLCTIQGDVWRVRGLDDDLRNVRWKRFASGLHQALGLKVSNGEIFVLGRDQITRLHDLNGDGEADFYECFSNIYETSAAGHDFICGLERDEQGRFYTVSGPQGLLRISADGKQLEVLATGFRNPDGLGLTPGGNVTVPCSEGEWTPASMICEVPAGYRDGAREGRREGEKHGSSPSISPSLDPSVPPFYGYGGPRDGRPPELPLVYLPRGLDNSSGGQTAITSKRWGPLEGQMLHFSFGTGAHFLLLRDELNGIHVPGADHIAQNGGENKRGREGEKETGDAAEPSVSSSLHSSIPPAWPRNPESLTQGAVVPLPGEFLSGAHRGRFAPHDGQLYVTGMTGWGSYTPDDGCFQRVRYTGERVQLPVDFKAHNNGMLVTFTSEVDRQVVAEPGHQFAQAWNYRYSSAYGSAEYSPSHLGVRGHDVWPVQSVHVLDDGRQVFFEIPRMQPVSVLHLHMTVDARRPVDLFATIHALREDFTDFPGYEPLEKSIAAHPLLVDLATASKLKPNPFRKGISGAREVVIEAGTNLSYSTRRIDAKPGEAIKLTFRNPDVVPHNWVLAKPGSLERVGDLANRLISDPEAAARHYVPETDDVLYYTDVVPPSNKFSIHFRAPDQPGRYPYLCTFPGHWMVMNGELVVDH